VWLARRGAAVPVLLYLILERRRFTVWLAPVAGDPAPFLVAAGGDVASLVAAAAFAVGSLGQ
jgi:hypothetical protein